MPSGNRRTHRERRLVPYSPEQFFEVVADVDSYKKFVPFCVDSRVVKVIDEGTMEAEMSVGFKVRQKRQSRRTMMVRENTGNTRPFRGGCRESCGMLYVG